MWRNESGKMLVFLIDRFRALFSLGIRFRCAENVNTAFTVSIQYHVLFYDDLCRG